MIKNGDRGNTVEFWDMRWGSKKQRAEKWCANRAFMRVKETSAKTVLELGCGVSRLLTMLRDANYQVFGIDLSQNAIDKLNQMGILGLAMNVDELDKLMMKFDYIVANHILEHLYEDEKFIKNCKEKLSKDGLLFVAVPNNTSSPDEAFDHCQIYDEKTLSNLMIKVFGNCHIETVTPRGRHLIGISKNE